MYSKPKGSFLGAAGQIYVMSELLARGWNVAIPVVDVGDDVLVVDDEEKSLIRIQVKTGVGVPMKTGGYKVTFNLSQLQLTTEYKSSLIFAFAIRNKEGWKRILWMERETLKVIRANFEQAFPFRHGTGISDRISLTLKIDPPSKITGWRSDLSSDFQEIDSIFPHLH